MNGMVLGPKAALDDIASNLELTLDAAAIDRPFDPILAEYLRSGLSALSRPLQEGGRPEPVYVARLTNMVRRQLAPVWPELSPRRTKPPSQVEMESEGDSQPDPLRRVLDALNDLRDVCDLGKGYWLPCPVRLIQLPDGGVLVVGGANRLQLSALLKADVTSTWIARTLKQLTMPNHLASSVTMLQTFESWIGEDTGDLASWTNRVLQWGKSELGASASEVGSFEVYAPWLRPKVPQFFRWVRSEDLTKAPEIVLCRSAAGRWGPRNYWLGSLLFRGGKAILEKESDLRPNDVRRLQFGLDMQHKAPTRVTTSRKGPDIMITLRSWLPPEERRLLLALARDVSAVPGRFPLTFQVAEKLSKNVLRLLEKLHIAIDRSGW